MPTRIIAHRGASADRPENTLAAFDEALRQGADGIELDLQLSRDDVPVVYHDRTLARAGGGRKTVGRLDVSELARLDIPTLEEVLRRYGRKTLLLLEIKGCRGRADAERETRLLSSVLSLVREARLGEEVRILSFDLSTLEQCARIAPELPRVLNLKPPRALGRSLREALGSVFALSADIRTLTPGFAAAVRDQGRPVLTYTCNTERQVERALAAGVDAIMTDRPRWLRGLLAEGKP